MYPAGCGRQYIWFAKWLDGSQKHEYNGKEWMILDFTKLRRQTLSQFGLLGVGRDLYYDVDTGLFHINDLQLSFAYGDVDFSRLGRYEDVISYKEAHCDMLDRSEVGIDSFNFGYKKNILFNDVTYSIKSIFQVLPDHRMFLHFQITASEDVQETFRITQFKDGMSRTTPFDAPLKKGFAGKLTLEVK